MPKHFPMPILLHGPFAISTPGGGTRGAAWGLWRSVYMKGNLTLYRPNYLLSHILTPLKKTPIFLLIKKIQDL